MAAGLAPSASRWWQGHEQQQRVQQARDKLATEAAAQKEALANDRGTVIADLRMFQATGQHEKVIGLAARYRLADDKDVQAIYQQSANALSHRQTVERMRALAAAQCRPVVAIERVKQLVLENSPTFVDINTENWTATRLPTAGALGAIQQQVRTYLAGSALDRHAHDAPQHARRFVADELRRDHTPRLHPIVVAQLLDNATAEPFACVWRVNGNIDAPATSRGGVDVVIWMAPAANEQTLDFDLLSARKGR
jgi:hypothetical protein